jgi:hypothetical protein
MDTGLQKGAPKSTMQLACHCEKRSLRRSNLVLIGTQSRDCFVVALLATTERVVVYLQAIGKKQNNLNR